MYVVGELINLEHEIKRVEKTGKPVRLPIPWYQRAPLGLLSETGVFVSLLEKNKKNKVGKAKRNGKSETNASDKVEMDKNGFSELGDLVVSVIDPTRTILRIQIRREEKAGVVTKVFSELDNIFSEERINVALAETVTTDCRNYHDITLIAELLIEETKKWGGKKKQKKNLKKLKETIQRKLDPVKVKVQKPLRNIAWLGKGTVRNGFDCDCDWYAAFQEAFGATNYDTKKVVVFSDQTNRIARFIIPKEKAVTFEIEHADIPGALAKLTKSLKKARLNLLTTLLRRGGVMPENASLVAVCEPEVHNDPRKRYEIRRDFEMSIKGIAPKFRIGKPKERRGRFPHVVLHPRHPEDRIIQVPQRLRSTVKAIRKECGNSIPTFLSRRFASDSYRGRHVAEIVRRVLVENNAFYPVEAHPDPLDENPTTIGQVESRLWACDFGIVLVVADQENEPFSGNLAHEYGFLHGQDKPVVFLVEKPLFSLVSSAVSNIQGLVMLSFGAGDVAYDDRSPQSVERRLREYLPRVKELLEKRRLGN